MKVQWFCLCREYFLFLFVPFHVLSKILHVFANHQIHQGLSGQGVSGGKAFLGSGYADLTLADPSAERVAVHCGNLDDQCIGRSRSAAIPYIKCERHTRHIVYCCNPGDPGMTAVNMEKREGSGL